MSAPAAAERLHRTAQQHGWASKIVTTGGHKLGKPDEPATCTTVQLRRNGWGVLAIWLDGAFRCALHRGKKINSIELKQLVAS